MISLVFDVQKGKFLAAEKFALLPALKRCSQEALHCRVQRVFLML
jgi:hypothetical protein